MKGEFKVPIKGIKMLPIDSLVPFQDDLKYLTPENLEKLIANIINIGFSEPIGVWENEKDGENYIISGHQRVLAIQTMKERGMKVPNELPCVILDIKNETDAREKLLSLASYYGDASERGLREYLKTHKIEIKKVQMRFPKINIKSLSLQEPEGSDEAKSSSSLDIILTCKDPEVRAKVFEMLQDHEMSHYYQVKMN